MFVDKLKASQRQTGGRLCVGLDPHPELVPGGGREAQAVKRFLDAVILQTKDDACAYKPNSAFFEALGSDGVALLRHTVDRIHDAGRLAILDAKRCDIASTAAAYARAAHDGLAADAITVVPYMGEDAILPFLDVGLAVFIVTLPSNPTAATIVDHGSPPLYVLVAELAARLEERFPGQVGLVVGATSPARARSLRDIGPGSPWLVPGVGAQGGELEAFLDAAGSDRTLVFNVSRGILAAERPGDAARTFNKAMGRPHDR
ncbi:MAG: orotidine-5'-phosphate decarboxylase [Candidatus Bipolaricaulis sp.]|nr:orotidine-5'-phosphate decarboxylase [Candidatus Bipolaricaulis sp.]